MAPKSGIKKWGKMFKNTLSRNTQRKTPVPKPLKSSKNTKTLVGKPTDLVNRNSRPQLTSTTSQSSSSLTNAKWLSLTVFSRPKPQRATARPRYTCTTSRALRYRSWFIHRRPILGGLLKRKFGHAKCILNLMNFSNKISMVIWYKRSRTRGISSLKDSFMKGILLKKLGKYINIDEK